MGELDIRLLLGQLRLKLEDTEDMERELVEWFKEWHRRHQEHPQKDESPALRS